MRVSSGFRGFILHRHSVISRFTNFRIQFSRHGAGRLLSMAIMRRATQSQLSGGRRGIFLIDKVHRVCVVSEAWAKPVCFFSSLLFFSGGKGWVREWKGGQGRGMGALSLRLPAWVHACELDASLRTAMSWEWTKQKESSSIVNI